MFSYGHFLLCHYVNCYGSNEWKYTDSMVVFHLVQPIHMHTNEVCTHMEYLQFLRPVINLLQIASCVVIKCKTNTNGLYHMLQTCCLRFTPVTTVANTVASELGRNHSFP